MGHEHTMVKRFAIDLLSRLPRSLKRALVVRYALWVRPMTLGVRVAAFNDADEVLLVRHTYIEGWHLPGGAVERGESVGAAARKELQEEAHIVPKDDGALTLFAVYKNEIMSRFDHVVLFVLQGSNQTAPKLPDSEIEEARFFACDALPEGTTEPTRRRLVEIAGRTAPRALW